MVRVPLPARVPPNRASDAMVDGSGPVSSRVAFPTPRLAPSLTSMVAMDASPASSHTDTPAPVTHTCDPATGSASPAQLRGSFQSPLAASASHITGLPTGSQPAAAAGAAGRASTIVAAARPARLPITRALPGSRSWSTRLRCSIMPPAPPVNTGRHRVSRLTGHTTYPDDRLGGLRVRGMSAGRRLRAP